MPTHGEAAEHEPMEVGDAGDQRNAATSTKVTASWAMKHVLQTIIQHAAEAFYDKLKPVTDVIGMLELSKINWNSNPGDVIAALLRTVGLAWSVCGKMLWRRAAPEDIIRWRKPAVPKGSLKPAAPRATALGDLSTVNLQHDADSGAAGSARAQAAAEAARPTVPRSLELVKPDAVDRLARGSGWGNSPHPLARCCIVEQSALDSLILRVEEHTQRCGSGLRRVDGGDDGDRVHSPVRYMYRCSHAVS